MNLSLFIFAAFLHLNTNGAHLRRLKRFPNGTQVLGGGRYVREPENSAQHPGSVVWTGKNNTKPSNSTVFGAEAVDGITCFSGAASVQTPTGRVTMQDLRIGDRIWTDRKRFEKVYAFGHRNPQRIADFLVVSLENDDLELTAAHLVFLEGHDNPVRADAIKVGDVLRGAQRVTRIGRTQRKGIYAPLTSSGTLVVNGVVASSYAALQETSSMWLGGVVTSSHYYSHMGLAPFRLYCRLSDESCLAYNEDGMPPFVEFGIRTSHWISSQNSLFQLSFMMGFFLVTGICSLLETTTGLVVAVAIVLVALHWRKNIKNPVPPDRRSQAAHVGNRETASHQPGAMFDLRKLYLASI